MSEHHPIVIVEDRYEGAYAGAQWIAVAAADRNVVSSKKSRLRFVFEDGPMANDTAAMDFWAHKPEWVAVGNTPDKALNNLLSEKM